MAEPSGKTAAAAKSSLRSTSIDWSGLLPVDVARADAMGTTAVADSWTRLYKAAGLKNPTEHEQAAFRLAVYAYGLYNGTSGQGDYTGTIQTATGVEFDAAVIVNVLGKANVRRFYRGNMDESYRSLKESRVALKDERFLARASELGAMPDEAFAIADWFKDCPNFSPLERRAHEASFKYSIRRARNARGGASVEELSRDRMDDRLDAEVSVHADRAHAARVEF